MTPEERAGLVLGELTSGEHPLHLSTEEAGRIVHCVEAAIAAAVAEERETIAAFVEDWTRYYPEDIFVPPPKGQHGQTVDACSAAAIRAILPRIAAAIRKGGEDG